MNGIEQVPPKWAAELVLHNWPVFLYVLGTVVAGVRALVHPSRASVLLLYGFLLLTLGFEYEKHGLRPVRGVIESIFGPGTVERDIAKLLVLRLLPPAIYLVGIASLVSSVILARRRSTSAGKEDGRSRADSGASQPPDNFALARRGRERVEPENSRREGT